MHFEGRIETTNNWENLYYFVVSIRAGQIPALLNHRGILEI
jgi:hypothetical protein